MTPHYFMHLASAVNSDWDPKTPRRIQFSTHAHKRMQQRGIHQEQVELGLKYGRYVRSGENTYDVFVGRKEIQRAKRDNIILDHLHNLHVVVSLDHYRDRVITVYRGDIHRPKGSRSRQKHRYRSRISAA